MAVYCYCGCGRKLGGGRKRLSKKVGPEVRETLAVLKKYSRPYAEGDDNEVHIVEDFIKDGEAYDQQLRDYIHGSGGAVPEVTQYFQWLRAAQQRAAKDLSDLKLMAISDPMVQMAEDPLLATLELNKMAGEVTGEKRLTPEKMSENLKKAMGGDQT